MCLAPESLGLFIGALWMTQAGIVVASDVALDLTLEEIYSSNINLEPDESAQSDFVTRISPSVYVDYRGNRSYVDIGYTYEALLYQANSEFNEDFHQLDSGAEVDLIVDELQLRGLAIYNQINVDPAKKFADTNVSITGNRTNAFIWSLGPDWHRKLPLNSEISAVYDVGQVDYEDPESQDVDSQRLGMRLATDSTVPTSLTYQLAYDYWGTRL